MPRDIDKERPQGKLAPSPARSRSTRLACIGVLVCAVSLSACSTAVQVATEKVAEIALNTIGVKLPETAGGSRIVKTLSLHLEGAKDLNAGDDGQGLVTVMRLYKLRDHTSFLSTPYTSFGMPETEKQAMGADLLETREIILSPGQTLDLKEKMAGEAAYLGVVALFRSPAPRRWRFAFPAANTKITMGVHACAMTVTDIAPVGMSVDETAFLSSIKCRQTNNDQPSI